MKRNLLETIMGALVLLVAGFFVATAYQNSGIKNENGYLILANFDRVDGITRGTDVKIGGIKIGTVDDMSLDTESFRAKVTFSINNTVKLPADSSAEIASEGLLGGKFVNIIPGADEETLKDGGKIEYTQSSINLEQLLGKFAFGSADDNKSGAPTEKTEENKTAPTPNE